MARAHALHILVKTKEEAEDLKKKLAGGARFADLAVIPPENRSSY